MPPSTIVGPSKFRPYRPNARVTDVSSGHGYGSTPPGPNPNSRVTDVSSGYGGYGPPTHAVGVGAPTPKQAAANAAAKTSSSMQQYLDYLNSNMGRQPSLLDQLTQPIIASYRAQAQAGDAQIQAMTEQYANVLQGIGAQSQAAYQQAEGQQQAVDTAVGTALQTGDVGAAASRLQQSLAMSGQNLSPATQAASDVSSTGAAMYASSSAGLTQLLQDSAATQAYNAQLPGLARLSGLQAIGAYNSGLSQAEAQAVSDAQKLLPSLMDAQTNQQKLGIDQYNAQTNRARVQAGIASQQAKASQPKIYGSAATGYFALTSDGKNVQLTAPGQKTPKTFSSGGNEYTFNPNTGQVTQLTSNPKAPKAPTVKTINGVSKQWDPSTGKWVSMPGGGKGGPALTPGEAQSYLKSITNKHFDSKAKTTIIGHTVGYGDAYKYLRSHGVGDVQARTLLDSSYRRGEDGRAWLSNEEQAVLKRAASGRGPGVGLKGVQGKDILAVNLDPVSHHRFLSPVQYQLLKSAGKLPQGAFQNTPVGPRYYIAQK